MPPITAVNDANSPLMGAAGNLSHLSSTSAPSASIPLSPSPSTSLIQRGSRWVEDNQRAILLSLAVLGVAGTGYWYFNLRDMSGNGGGRGLGGGSGTAGSGAGEGKKKSKKNKKKGGEKYLKGGGTEGPLLESVERDETAVGAASGAQGEKEDEGKVQEKETEKEKEKDDPFRDVPDAAAVAAMTDEQRNALGGTLKEKGNKMYQKKEYELAVACYTKALEIAVNPHPMFYSNRAACYTNYKPPEWEKCVEDCTEAIKLDRNYTKAVKRRAGALENLGREEEAVRDFTATTIIERFQDESAAVAVERCLKKLAEKKAKVLMETREPKLPSPTFISSYLSAFRPHSKPSLPANPSQGDRTLDLAFDALTAADYTHAFTFSNEAIEQGISWAEGQSEAYNLRGTFKFLLGDATGAKEDFEKSLELVPSFVQSWVKIASVHMELGDAASAFGDFEAAIRHNADDPDIYYHRGQVYFITQEFEKAIADYSKSTELDGSFIFTHVQQAVSQYKLSNIGGSMASFRRILKQFPDRGEPSNYYGELLLDQQKFAESVERFDRALELDKNKKPRNVLPLVNKALAIFQWKRDSSRAEALCKEALEVDPDCDVAVATLAQLSLQAGNIDEAIKWFEKSAQLARTETELINAITYEHASRAQQAFLKNYPEFADRLAQMAQAI